MTKIKKKDKANNKTPSRTCFGVSAIIYSMASVDHIFTASKAHTYNEIVHFYRALKRPNKYLFTDMPGIKNGRNLKNLSKFKPTSSKAILYATYTSHIDLVKGLYKECKIVQMYHGINTPWAKVLTKPQKRDVAICASMIDKQVWKKYAPHQHTEIIGWPRGEEFFSKLRLAKTNPKHICMNSNWTETRSAFEVCDRLEEIDDYSITLTLHPHLESKKVIDRKVDMNFFRKQINKLHKNVCVVKCPHGVLPHFKNKSLLLGVLSSSSIEWLLFDKPIIFLKHHDMLNYGPLLDDRPLDVQIKSAINHEDTTYVKRRKKMRKMLMSHFDGKWKQRFEKMVGRLEKKLA